MTCNVHTVFFPSRPSIKGSFMKMRILTKMAGKKIKQDT